jgi:hypothetical protein
VPSVEGLVDDGSAQELRSAEDKQLHGTERYRRATFPQVPVDF